MSTTPSGSFAGFPADALAFYRELEADNSKAFWHANKHRYEASVRGPMQQLCESMPKNLQPFNIFRPYRDVRFAKDKTPYKTQCGAVAERQGGSAVYVALDKDGMYSGGGYYHFANDQLERFRSVLDDAKKGPAFVKLVEATRASGHEVASFESLKSAPRGYPKDHPRIEFLRMKGLHAGTTLGKGPWLRTPEARDRVLATWKGVESLTNWLDKHVGPSTEPPDERWVR